MRWFLARHKKSEPAPREASGGTAKAISGAARAKQKSSQHRPCGECTRSDRASARLSGECGGLDVHPAAVGGIVVRSRPEHASVLATARPTRGGLGVDTGSARAPEGQLSEDAEP